MMEDDAIRINEQLVIPRAELSYRATRAGGPGGQHVNTSATRIELTWDVSASPSLSEEQRAYLLIRLASRLDSRGVLRLVAAGERSQLRNREAATERFASLLATAMRRPKPRRRTKPTRAAREARLRSKKQRGERKRERGPVQPDD